MLCIQPATSGSQQVFSCIPFMCCIFQNLTCTFFSFPTLSYFVQRPELSPPPPPLVPSSRVLPFRPSSSRVLQKKVSAAAKACSRRRARLQRDVFSEDMDSVRDSRCYLIFLFMQSSTDAAASVNTLKKMYCFPP